MAPKLRNLDHGTRSDTSWSRRREGEGNGADEDRCKKTEQLEGATKQGRVNLRRRGTPFMSDSEVLEGFFLSVFPIT